MITIEVTKKPDLNWNKRLIKAQLGTTNQTIERGINFDRTGQSPRFMKFIDNNGNIVGQLLFSISSRLDKKGLPGKVLKRITGLKLPLYFWIYGPIIFDQEKNEDIFSSLRNFLNSKKCKVYGTTNPLIPTDPDILKKNFQITEWATYIIDLRKSKEELYNNIEKHSGRKNIERAIKRGVTIEEINEKSLVKYHEIRTKFQETLEEKKTDFKHMLAYWKLMKPLGFSGFLAKKGGIEIGGLMFHYFNNVIVEAGVARSKQDLVEKLYAHDLIKWKIIEWGVKNKMKYYDLAGFNLHPKLKKEEGIKRYKTKWGGQKYSYWIIKK